MEIHAFFFIYPLFYKIDFHQSGGSLERGRQQVPGGRTQRAAAWAGAEPWTPGGVGRREPVRDGVEHRGGEGSGSAGGWELVVARLPNGRLLEQRCPVQ